MHNKLTRNPSPRSEWRSALKNIAATLADTDDETYPAEHKEDVDILRAENEALQKKVRLALFVRARGEEGVSILTLWIALHSAGSGQRKPEGQGDRRGCLQGAAGESI